MIILNGTIAINLNKIFYPILKGINSTNTCLTLMIDCNTSYI